MENPLSTNPDNPDDGSDAPPPDSALPTEDETWVAKKRLFDLHRGELRRFLLRRLYGPDGIEDALQELFVRFLGCDLSKIRSIRAYLIVVARNLVAEMAERQQREQMFVRLDSIEPDRFPAAHCEPDERLLTEIDIAWLKSAIAQLPTRERLVVELYRTGLSRQQIADACRIKLSDVNNRLTRAITLLTQKLEKPGTEVCP
jgi:RNA polymerase sigma-70 factor (ECF subfamily)